MYFYSFTDCVEDVACFPVVGGICADFALNCSFCVKNTKFSEMIEIFILVNT